MIKSFRHKGLREFFETGNRAGIQAKHAERLALQLDVLDSATSPEEMRLLGWRLHALQGQRRGLWAVNVSGNWRMVFGFEGEDAILVDYLDYH